VAYSPRQACRHAGISLQLLAAWVKQGFLPATGPYQREHLAVMKTLAQLRAAGFSGARLRRAIARLDRTDVPSLLAEMRVVKRGKRVIVRIPGQEVELSSGQLRMRFEDASITTAAPRQSVQEDRQRRQEAEVWFQRGLELEQSGAPVTDVIAAYRKAAELDDRSAGALVNLGTLFFNAQKWKEAERYYVKALEAEPTYALAHFNLANLYDERGDRPRALEHYEQALRLKPSYADAHYNLALLHQTTGQVMKALKHWKTYIKLDPTSSWAVIARRELKKLQTAALVEGAKSPAPVAPRERGLTAV
jgi:tetratricopeptide (TPR) repeat protein